MNQPTAKVFALIILKRQECNSKSCHNEKQCLTERAWILNTQQHLSVQAAGGSPTSTHWFGCLFTSCPAIVRVTLLKKKKKPGTPALHHYLQPGNGAISRVWGRTCMESSTPITLHYSAKTCKPSQDTTSNSFTVHYVVNKYSSCLLSHRKSTDW